MPPISYSQPVTNCGMDIKRCSFLVVLGPFNELLWLGDLHTSCQTSLELHCGLGLFYPIFPTFLFPSTAVRTTFAIWWCSETVLVSFLFSLTGIYSNKSHAYLISNQYNIDLNASSNSKLYKSQQTVARRSNLACDLFLQSLLYF